MRSWFSWTFYAHLPLVATAHLSVVTWNILAPEFATPTKYPWASADALAWPSRQERILLKLAEIDADIVCLQEVGVAQWDELCGRLHTLGYDGILQEMSRGHPIANAILLRRGHVELLRAESRSRALIAVVRACGGTASKPQPLYLANVHLEAGAEKSATRLSQLRSLLRRIELQCSVNIAAEVRAPMSSVDGARSPVAIVGDFNSDRSSDVHELLSSHGNKARSADKRRLLSNPLLPLRDAYSDHPPPWGPSLKSSYRNGRLLDFIWTSSSVSVVRTMPVCTMAGSSQPHQLPSLDNPSDHLPIGALLTFDGAPTVPVTSSRRPAWQQLFVENVQRQASRRTV